MSDQPQRTAKWPSRQEREGIIYRDGFVDGLWRARALAVNGLHVDPRATLQDFLAAIDAILVEEAL